MDDLKFSVTDRKKEMAIYRSYMYTLKRQNGDLQTWRCKDRSCNGLLKVNTGTKSTEEVVPHNHAAEPGDVAAHVARQEMKRKAVESLDAPRQVYKKVTSIVGSQAVASLPKYRSCQRTIQRQRKIPGFPLANPKTRAEIDPVIFLQTLDRGEDFLLADTGSEDSNRILLFGSAENVNHLASAEVWLGDGTFKVAPPMFAQLYTIHAELYGTVIPLVYALLPDKSTETYTRMFSLLKGRIEALTLQGSTGPKTMIVDFEKAVITGLQSVFPRTTMQGCSFHLGQSFYRHVQSLGLVTEYTKEGSDFNLHCKMMLALQYLPVKEVPAAWEELMNSAEFKVPRDHPLAVYFVETYVGKLVVLDNGMRMRLRAQYPVSFWNCHERLLAGIQRTTNRLEAWHLRHLLVVAIQPYTASSGNWRKSNGYKKLGW